MKYYIWLFDGEFRVSASNQEYHESDYRVGVAYIGELDTWEIDFSQDVPLGAPTLREVARILETLS